jgi:hypothetical protein
MDLDPAVTNAQFYEVVFENDRVRVLEYTDSPGDRTTPHAHPDSVMYTLSSFRRRLHQDGQHRDVEIPAGTTGWLPAQEHAGENVGETPDARAVRRARGRRERWRPSPGTGVIRARTRAGAAPRTGRPGPHREAGRWSPAPTARR